MDAVMNFFSGLLVVAAIIGVILLIAIVFLIVYVVRHIMFAMRGEEYVPIITVKRKQPAYEHQDVDAGATTDSIRKVLKRYMHTETVGVYARNGMSILEDDERKAAFFHSTLDRKFEHGSLSWEKFAVAANTTHKAVLGNCAALANRIQTFDYLEYRHLTRTERNAAHKRGEPLDATQQEKLALMRSSLADMDALVHANEQLLLELDKLAAELSKLSDVDVNDESDRIVGEIRTLIDETKYYSKSANE